MMVKFFVESKHDNTVETVFLQTLLCVLGISKNRYKIEHVNGRDNLKNMENVFIDNSLNGGKNFIIFDADRTEDGAGYQLTEKRIYSTFMDKSVIDGIFLFPNNHDDGILENLLEHLMQKDKHKRFLDCFSDYEHCLGDDYVSPDLKGKLHTYMSAQKDLSNTKRNKLGSGQWLFDDKRFWNLDVDYILPLKNFLSDCFG